MTFVSAWWHRFEQWAGKLDASVTMTEPVMLPQELTSALDEHEQSRATWLELEPAERGALSSFVASARFRRGRTRRAAAVAQRCADGLDGMREWMAMNGAMLPGGTTLGPPGWTG